jgi:hypothetical protein
LAVGSKHEAVRSEIVKGACTPVMFRFTKLVASWGGSPWASPR